MDNIPTGVAANHMRDDVWEEVLEYINTARMALQLETVCHAFYFNIHKRQRTYFWNYETMENKTPAWRTFFNDKQIAKMPNLEKLILIEAKMSGYLVGCIRDYVKQLTSLSITFDSTDSMRFLFGNERLFCESNLKHFTLDTDFEEANLETNLGEYYRIKMTNTIRRLDYLRSLKFWPLEHLRLPPDFQLLTKLALNFTLEGFGSFCEFHLLLNQVTDLALYWDQIIPRKYFTVIFSLIKKFVKLKSLQLMFALTLVEEAVTNEEGIYLNIKEFLEQTNTRELVKLSITVHQFPNKINLERVCKLCTRYMPNLSILEYRIDHRAFPVAVQAPQIRKFYFEIMRASYDNSRIISEFENSANVRELCLTNMEEINIELLSMLVHLFPNIQKIQIGGQMSFSYDNLTDNDLQKIVSQWKELRILVFRDRLQRPPFVNVLKLFIMRARSNPHLRFVLYIHIFFRRNCTREILALLNESIKYPNLTVC